MYRAYMQSPNKNRRHVTCESAYYWYHHTHHARTPSNSVWHRWMVASRDRIRSNDFTLVAIAMMTPAGSDMNCTIDFGPGWSKGTGEWVGVCLYKLMLFFFRNKFNCPLCWVDRRSCGTCDGLMLQLYSYCVLNIGYRCFNRMVSLA